MPHETRYISWLGIRYMSAAPIGTEAGVVRAPVRRCSMFSDAHLFLNHLPISSSGSRPKQTFKLATNAKMSASMASNLAYEGAAAAVAGALATLGWRSDGGSNGHRASSHPQNAKPSHLVLIRRERDVSRVENGHDVCGRVVAWEQALQTRGELAPPMVGWAAASEIAMNGRPRERSWRPQLSAAFQSGQFADSPGTCA